MATASTDNDTFELAEAYSTMNEPQFKFGLKMLEQLDIQNGMVVVDVGCGTGELALHVAERFGCKVIGVDPEDKRIEIAKKRAQEKGCANVDFHVCSAEDLDGLLEGEVDVFLLSSVLHWLSDPVVVLEAMRKRLRVGGRVGITTTVAGASVSSPKADALSVPPFNAFTPTYLSTSFSEERLREIFAGAGFAHPSITLLRMHLAFDNVDALLSWISASSFGNFWRLDHIPEALHEEAKKAIDLELTKIWGTQFFLRGDFYVDILVRLSGTLEDQVAILRRIDERQNASDASRQHPITEVLATITSAWNALLRSTLTETIQPKVERWRSGLDALLVFMGLFSGIVTSFFVPSLSSLQEDPAVRMNALLANLTDVVVALNGVPPASLMLAHPHPLKLDPTAVRLNSYCSLSIAALAVACRGLLNTTSYSHFSNPAEKLIDIRTRWASSERFLAPTIELLPQILVLPVLLFIAGLLDTLFSNVLQLSPVPIPTLSTSGAALLFTAGVAPLPLWTLARRSLNPAGSLGLRRCATAADSLSDQAPAVYHAAVQATHDDAALDEASASLYQIIRAAVQIIISRVHDASRLQYSAAAMCALVPAFIDAARREPRADLWSPPFSRAMAIVANAGSVVDAYPPVLCIMTSEYIDNLAVRSKTIKLLVEVLFTRVVEDGDAALAFHVAGRSIGKANTGPINPARILVSLLCFPHKNTPALETPLRWLISCAGPAAAIRAAQTLVDGVASADVWTVLLFHVVCMLGRMCLSLPPGDQETHAQVAQLCASSLRKIALQHQFHPLISALLGVVAQPVDALGVLSAPVESDIFLGASLRTLWSGSVPARHPRGRWTQNDSN
ncbi:unnamed protein product [Mycena citricolor]|uniref:Methyltransferase domain-containing protein n=1 Tax=Mycena citricolor TaxID=2018698 RepID=A0AAD2GVM5_9AGAR|nr:unnamed protein product [Mycena citricolor]